MMGTGIALTTLASLALVGGGVVTALDQGHPGDMHGFMTVVVGVPMMAGSVLFAAAGIPLWVVGASPSRKSAPAIAVGAGSATLRWTF